MSVFASDDDVRRSLRWRTVGTYDHCTPMWVEEFKRMLIIHIFYTQYHNTKDGDGVDLSTVAGTSQVQVRYAANGQLMTEARSSLPTSFSIGNRTVLKDRALC